VVGIGSQIERRRSNTRHGGSGFSVDRVPILMAMRGHAQALTGLDWINPLDGEV
jgi:hypothetical protein